MTELTAQQITDEVLRIADAHPDAVYEGPRTAPAGCYYNRGKLAGERGCLFGQAFRNLGSPIAKQDDAKPIDAILEGHSESYLAICQQVQDNQDKHIPIGQAVEPLRALQGDS